MSHPGAARSAKKREHGLGASPVPFVVRPAQLKRDGVTWFTEPWSAPVHPWSNARARSKTLGKRTNGSRTVIHQPSVGIQPRVPYIEAGHRNLVARAGDVFFSEDILRGDEWRPSIEKHLRDGQSRYLILARTGPGASTRQAISPPSILHRPIGKSIVSSVRTSPRRVRSEICNGDQRGATRQGAERDLAKKRLPGGAGKSAALEEMRLGNVTQLNYAAIVAA